MPKFGRIVKYSSEGTILSYSTNQPSLVSLFQGFSSAEGKSKPSTIIHGETTTGNASSEIGLKVTLSSFELRQAQGVSREAGIGMDGLGSISQLTEFYQSLKITETTLCVVAYAKRYISTVAVTDSRLKDGIRAPATAEQVNEFVHSYGDTFVSEITKGGQYFEVFTFHCHSVEQMTEVKNSLAAEGVVEGINVQASLEAKLSVASKNFNLQYGFNQKMIGVESEKYPTQDEAIDFVLHFINDNKVKIDRVCAFKITSYFEVAQLTSAFKGVKHNQDLLYGSGVGQLFKQCGLYQLNQLDALALSLSEIDQIYLKMNATPDDSYAEKRAAVLQEQSAITKIFEEYVRDPSKPIVLPATPALHFGIPVLQLESQTQANPVGGPGGKAFSDFVVFRDFYEIGFPIALNVQAGRYIDQISTEYKKTASNSSLVVIHGRPGGDNKVAITLHPGEYIQKISAQGGTYVDYLKYELNTGATFAAGSYQSHLTLHTLFDASNGFRFYGYIGRSQSWIDQLQVFAVRPKAIVWVK